MLRWTDSSQTAEFLSSNIASHIFLFFQTAAGADTISCQIGGCYICHIPAVTSALPDYIAFFSFLCRADGNELSEALSRQFGFLQAAAGSGNSGHKVAAPDEDGIAAVADTFPDGLGILALLCYPDGGQFSEALSCQIPDQQTAAGTDPPAQQVGGGDKRHFSAVASALPDDTAVLSAVGGTDGSQISEVFSG